MSGLQFSSTLRTDQAGAISTRLGSSGTCKFFSGALPANCAAGDPSGTLITLTLGNPAFTSASGVATLAGTPNNNASATGLARCFRMYDGSSNCHVQGYISENWATSTAYALNQQVNAGGNIYVCATAGTSASSGSGPTGTGTGITDGTATWNYVAAVEGIILNSTSLTVGQPTSIASYTITVPNS